MIWTLIKINVAALFSGMFLRNRGRKKIKPVTVVLIGLLIVYIVAAMAVTVGVMFGSLCAPLFEAGIGWLYFALAGIIEFAICFIGGVFMVQAQIFSARDNELLLSMPIKPRAILGGRLSALMIIEYVFAAVIVLPVFVVLIITGQISAVPATGVVFYFIAAVLVPLLAVAFGCLIGWLVAMLSSRMRRKNIPTLILSLAFLTVYLWLYTGIMNNLGALIINGAEIAEALRRTVFPAYHLGMAIAGGNVLSFLIFAFCAIAPFAVMYALLSVSFMKLAAGGRGAKKLEYREKVLRVSGARPALLKRELLHFWTQPMYIMNSALGAIATLVLTGVMIVRPGLLTGLFDANGGMFAGLIDPGIVGAVVLAALAMMNFISAPSISLEGKRLWIVKSLPVHALDILLSKAGMHIVVSGVPAFIAGIVYIAMVPMNVAQLALTLILPAVVTLMFSLLGVTLNLAFPRFDWINPLQPVKQGLSAMLSMFGGMALIIALAIIYVLPPRGAAMEIYLLICTAGFIAASAGLYFYLAGAGSRKFESL